MNVEFGHFLVSYLLTLTFKERCPLDICLRFKIVGFYVVRKCAGSVNYVSNQFLFIDEINLCG